MSRLLYERSIFRDSEPGVGVKAASAFAGGLSNKRVTKIISICSFCFFVLSGVSNAFDVNAFPGSDRTMTKVLI